MAPVSDLLITLQLMSSDNLGQLVSTKTASLSGSKAAVLLAVLLLEGSAPYQDHCLQHS